MNQRLKYQRVISLFLAVLLVAILFVPTTLSVSAANKHFITELRVEKGDGSLTELEEQGWSVMMTGLNATTDAASQVYLLYKVDTGSPITDVVVSPDVGESFTDENGIVYKCVSHVDVDDGIGGGAGCLYATIDAKAGSALVAFDVLRSNKDSKETLYPITNDGAEVVATRDGTPADIEAGSQTDVIYLAMIRDGLVKPYIREIGIITDTDKWNAVYTAFERGFTYYVDGDIDDSPDTYTIIGYERTADPSDSITNIIAVTEQTVAALEEGHVIDNAENGTQANVTSAVVSISGVEYDRTSSKPVKADESFYLYRTKDAKAGNPISMLYAETYVKNQNFLFGMWANGYFFTQGLTTAFSYCMNEDLYATIWDDKTVCTKMPVQLIDYISSVKTTSSGAPGDDSTTEEPTAEDSTTTSSEAEKPTVEDSTTTSSEAEKPTVEDSTTTSSESEEPSVEDSATEGSESEEPSVEDSATEGSESEEPILEDSTIKSSQAEEQSGEESTEEDDSEVGTFSVAESSEQELTAPGDTATSQTVRYIDLTMLTPRDGLPNTTASLTGMRGDPAAPYVERTERSDRINKLQASVFGKFNILTPVIAAIIVIAAVVFFIYKKVHKEKAPDGPKKTNKQNKPGKQTKPDNKGKQNIKNRSKKSKKSKKKR